MIILTIRTDKPEAEVGLYEDHKQLVYKTWEAYRELSSTIHNQITDLLQSQGKNWNDIEGVVCFQGPGSFTGLRIGLSVGNALAKGLNIPIVATQSDWAEQGIARLLAGKSDVVALPEYGQLAHVTSPKK